MRKFLRWQWLLLLPIVIGPIASLTLSKLEERDTFCIVCHTLPEVTYHQRAVQATEETDPALDLSSSHYQLEASAFRCIDCHRGADTIPHRLIAQGLAARDTLIWLTGRADPALEKGTVTLPILLDAACVRCHEETLLTIGFENHFHAYLPEAYALLEGGAEAIHPPGLDTEVVQGPGSEPIETEVSCVDCHKAHVQTPGAELQGYLDLVTDVYPACETCHADSGHGPLQLSGGGS